MKTIYSDREAWLQAASVLLFNLVFPSAGISPADWEQKKFRVSCGFPIGYRGSRTGKVTIGQAFDPSISADGTCEIFINPILDKPEAVVAVLAHELIHAYAGIQEGHKGQFKRIARAIGLVGPLTATVAGEELAGTIATIVSTLGVYPHAKIDPQQRRKQGTRLLKLFCGNCEWTARVSALQAGRLSEHAPCPCCEDRNSLNLITGADGE